MCQINWEYFCVDFNWVAIQQGTEIDILGSHNHGFFIFTLTEDSYMHHLFELKQHWRVEFYLLVFSYNVKDEVLIEGNVRLSELGLGLVSLLKETDTQIDVFIIFGINEINEGFGVDHSAAEITLVGV